MQSLVEVVSTSVMEAFLGRKLLQVGCSNYSGLRFDSSMIA